MPKTIILPQLAFGLLSVNNRSCLNLSSECFRQTGRARLGVDQREQAAPPHRCAEQKRLNRRPVHRSEPSRRKRVSDRCDGKGRYRVESRQQEPVGGAALRFHELCRHRLPIFCFAQVSYSFVQTSFLPGVSVIKFSQSRVSKLLQIKAF